MLITVIFYSFPLIFVLTALFFMLNRANLNKIFGPTSGQLFNILGVLFIVYGALGFVLVLYDLIDFMLIWILVALILIAFTVYVLKKVYDDYHQEH